MEVESLCMLQFTFYCLFELSYRPSLSSRLVPEMLSATTGYKKKKKSIFHLVLQGCTSTELIFTSLKKFSLVLVISSKQIHRKL